MDYQPPTTTAPLSVCLTALKRKPVRITITVSAALFERLQTRSDEEGRSLSNLAAFLLERVAADHPTK
jgi:hypothetical protein